MSKELTPKTGQFDEIISIIDNARTPRVESGQCGIDSDVLECWRIPFFAVR